MIWIMLAPQLMEENGRPPLEISPPLIYQMLAPRPPFLPLAPPPKIRGCILCQMMMIGFW